MARRKKAEVEVEAQAVEAPLVAPPRYLGPCPTCGRADEREHEWCDFCIAAYPAQWAAHQGLVAVPLLTSDEQARMDVATSKMVIAGLWPPRTMG